MRIVLSIGCNIYDYLKPLRSAEKDARSLFESLANLRSGYSQTESILLCSPTLSEIQHSFSDIARKASGIDALTFFFAGHGATKAGNYYLCPRDADPDSLSTSALTLSWLLAFMAEKSIRQVNFVLDACESGGAMLDTPSLLKREVIEAPKSSSISFLAASSVSELAGETEEGGRLTSLLLEYIRGNRKSQEVRPHLDLVEIGRCISTDMVAAGLNQTPVTWGLNLYGQGEFAANPYFIKTPESIPLQGIPPNSDLGEKVQRHAHALWREYRLIVEEQSARRLMETLLAVTQDLRTSPAQLWSFIRGLSTTLRMRVASSKDLFAEYNAVATCAVGLLPYSDAYGVDSVIKDFARELSDISRSARAELQRMLRKDSKILISPRGIFGNLFYLPLRVTKILGWLGLSAILDNMADLMRQTDIEQYNEISQVLIAEYKGSLVTISDEQSSFLYIFSKAAHLWKGESVAAQALTSYIDSFVSIEGRVARTEIEPAQALSYILSRAQDFQRIDIDLLARPGQMLSVLFLAATQLGIEKYLDSFLITLDGQTAYVFLPADHRDFASRVIEDGSSYLYVVGRDLWRSEAFLNLVKMNVAANDSESQKIEKHVQILCLISAYLFPNRVPLFLENINPAFDRIEKES